MRIGTKLKFSLLSWIINPLSMLQFMKTQLWHFLVLPLVLPRAVFCGGGLAVNLLAWSSRFSKSCEAFACIMLHLPRYWFPNPHQTFVHINHSYPLNPRFDTMDDTWWYIRNLQPVSVQNILSISWGQKLTRSIHQSTGTYCLQAALQFSWSVGFVVMVNFTRD